LIKNLNPRLPIEHWSVLDRQLKPKGQRLILIERDSHKIIRERVYKVFTALTQETIKVIIHPEGPKQEEGAATSPAPQDLSARGKDY
jgi:hypothetical protein